MNGVVTLTYSMCFYSDWCRLLSGLEFSDLTYDHNSLQVMPFIGYIEVKLGRCWFYVYCEWMEEVSGIKITYSTNFRKKKLNCERCKQSCTFDQVKPSRSVFLFSNVFSTRSVCSLALQLNLRIFNQAVTL